MKTPPLPRITPQQWQQFGALVRDRRSAAKLSRLTLARLAKLSESTLKFIETAHHPPSRATLFRLLAVADLHLTWAQVPGHQASAAEKQNLPALSPSPPPPPPSPPPAQSPVEPSTDPAQFLMDLIGFDEIPLPPGIPKTLRIFQQRHSVGALAGDKHPKDGREGA